MEQYDAGSFGRRIAKLRVEHGMTQAELSEKVHVSEKHLSAVERGVYTPSAETVFFLAKVLSTSADYLLTGELQKPIDACVQKFLEQASRNQQEAVWKFLREITREETDE